MKTLFVGALPFRSDEHSIRKIFEAVGQVGSVQVNADWENPTFEPHAFVEIDNFEKAIEQLDGKKIGNTHLRVHERNNHE